MQLHNPAQAVDLASPDDVDNGDDVVSPLHDYAQVRAYAKGEQVTLIPGKPVEVRLFDPVPACRQVLDHMQHPRPLHGRKLVEVGLCGKIPFQVHV